MPQGKGFIKGADVYRSDDGGKTLAADEPARRGDDELRLNNNSGTYGWVFGQIRVDPKTEDTIWIMGVPLSKSTDGGKTFRPSAACTAIITGCGSTRPTPTSSTTPTTAASTRRPTAARPGASR